MEKWSKKIGESKKNLAKYPPINFINNVIGITSYSLALFMGKYLRTNQRELATKGLETPEALEQSVLSVVLYGQMEIFNRGD